MRHSARLKIVHRSHERRGMIVDDKNPEYAGDLEGHSHDETFDTLGNFKKQGKRWHVTDFEAVLIYGGKHLDSVETTCAAMVDLIRHASTDGQISRKARSELFSLVTRGEGLIGRLDDLRNYLDILECQLAEMGIHPEVDNQGDSIEKAVA